MRHLGVQSVDCLTRLTFQAVGSHQEASKMTKPRPQCDLDLRTRRFIVQGQGLIGLDHVGHVDGDKWGLNLGLETVLGSHVLTLNLGGPNGVTMAQATPSK